jgi:2-polyprenyl-3-methyl-5-hydroxy-6-metoxy-1,4-benzoquinol methylase
MTRGEKYKVQLTLADENDARVIAYHFVDKESSVLDVGCACGDFGGLLNDRKSCRVYGFDYDADSLELASATGSYRHLEWADLNVYDMDRHPEWKGYFDYITFLDVLEHLVTPRDSLDKLLGYLKPSGHVVISLPNLAFGDIKLGLLNNEFCYTSTGILDNTHLRFFTYKSIAGFLAESRLVVVDAGFKLSRLNPKLMAATDTELLAHIRGDPHSFIYQYVMKCGRSDLSIDEITAINVTKLNVAFADIRSNLLLLGAREMLAAAIPPGSIWRRILSNAVAMIRSIRS